MTGIKFESLDDLNIQAMNWNIKVNSKVHATTDEIPNNRLPKERLSPLVREYIIDSINLRKVEKDCLISYSNNKYSVPAEYIGKHVTVVVLDNMLAAYYLGKQIALHLLSYHKKDMVVNKNHYRQMLFKQDFDIENTLLHNIKTIDFNPFDVDLGVYDV
jgi:hypothetical protein